MPSKTDVRHWLGAVFQDKYLYKGEFKSTHDYSVRIQHGGLREKFPLGSPNRNAAALKAREIYEHIKTNGLDAAIAKYKGKHTREIGPIVTIGDLTREILAITKNEDMRTVDAYLRNFRRIAGDVFQMDSQSGGRDKWILRVNAIRLADIQPSDINRWKVEFINRVGNDPAKIRSAKISVNSMLKNAASLFAAKRIEHLPNPELIPNPFKGVRFEPRQNQEYRGGFSIQEVTRAALLELDQESLKIFLLAAMAGLRRDEIDKLQWAAFKWEQGILSIEPTQYFRPKSEKSIAAVDLDEEMLAMFRAQAGRDSEFVISSDAKPRPGVAYYHYRCEAIMGKLCDWLRTKGVSGKSPLHTLRKEYGSQVNTKHGIYAASTALRHSNISITAQHYVRNTVRVTADLGHLLALKVAPLHETQG
jgi:integrase